MEGIIVSVNEFDNLYIDRYYTCVLSSIQLVE